MNSPSLDLASISAAALGRLYRNGTITPVAAVDWFLERITLAADPAIFLAVTAERARREAHASAERYRGGNPIGPLDGVPVAWKDLFDVAGTTTTAGSEIFRSAPPAKVDAAAVRKLSAAGMVTVGKVNLTEFAYSGLGLNPHFGTPRNPHDAAVHRAPGGSSSGSAVAVAGGLVPCAIGTDTGGSVRVPAAFNGVTGLKTAEGRIDTEGVFALSPTLDTIGPLARTVEDCVLLDAALRGAELFETGQSDLSRMTFVVPKNVVFDDAQEDVVSNFHRVVAELVRKGARVVEKDIALLDEIQAIAREHGTITAAEAYYRHRALVESPDRRRIDPRVVTRILRGADMSAYDLISLQEARILLRRRMIAELNGALLAMPTVPHTAPAVAPLDSNAELFQLVNAKTLRNTMIGNFLNLCGVAIPTGKDSGGLPTSILISAPGGSESLLLSASLAVESIVSVL